MTALDAEIATEEQHLAISLTDEQIANIEQALHNKQIDVVEKYIKSFSVHDTADLLQKLSPEDREKLLEAHGHHINAHAFTELDSELQRTVLSAMSATKVAGIISELESDDALDLIEDW